MEITWARKLSKTHSGLRTSGFPQKSNLSPLSYVKNMVVEEFSLKGTSFPLRLRFEPPDRWGRKPFTIRVLGSAWQSAGIEFRGNGWSSDITRPFWSNNFMIHYDIIRYRYS